MSIVCSLVALADSSLQTKMTGRRAGACLARIASHAAAGASAYRAAAVESALPMPHEVEDRIATYIASYAIGYLSPSGRED